MNTALVISLGAVAISLFTVFIAVRGAKSKKQTDGDGGTSYVGSDSSSDCSTSDGAQ
jgi:amino acid transporter